MHTLIYRLKYNLPIIVLHNIIFRMYLCIQSEGGLIGESGSKPLAIASTIRQGDSPATGLPTET